MNSGTAPAFITTCVWSAVPEAMFVNAHAASNWSNIDEVRKSCLLVYTSAPYLKHGMVSLQELDKSWDDAAINNFLDRGILLLGQKLAKFCGSV